MSSERLAVAALLVLAAPRPLRAERATTLDALARVEEVLTLRIDEGVLVPTQVLPAVIVSARPAYEESASWYPTAALAALGRVLDPTGLRVCEACMAPRTYVMEGRLESVSSSISIEEIVRLDDGLRGTSHPARAAVWLDETPAGVSLRIVDLSTGRLLFAQNFDPRLKEAAASERSFTLSEELERRARGDAITQIFLDASMYPGQHFSVDWTEQWGDTNSNLSGVTISLYDPVLGLGAAYYRVTNAFNATVGAKLIMSVPTALVRNISGEDIDVIDNLLTGVLVVRVPFGSSNYGAVLTLSTNGRVGVGLSLLNMSVLPVLP